MSEQRADIDPNVLLRGGAASPAVPPPALTLSPGLSLPQQRTASPDTIVPSQAGPPIDPSLNPLVDKIVKGESGGDPRAVYGGNLDQYGFPKWPGAQGPAGITHAAGLGQFQPDTWKRAQGLAQSQLGRQLDFFNKDDQRWAIAEIAKQDYKSRTGRDLTSDSQAGRVDENALVATWSSLRKGDSNPALEAANESAQNVKKGYYDAAGNLQKEARGFIDNVNKGGGGIEEAMKRIRAAQDKSDEASDAVLKATKQQPHQPDIDGVKHFGSVATIVGLLGGLFTRHPFQASLNAAGAAMEAYNKSDLETYKLQYGAWKDNTELLLSVAKMNRERVHDILADEKLGFDEKRVLLDSTLRGIGLEKVADEMRTRGDEAAYDWNKTLFNAEEKTKEARARIEASQARLTAQLEGNHPEAYLFNKYRQEHPDANAEELNKAWHSIKDSYSKGAKGEAERAFVEETIEKTGQKPTSQAWIEWSGQNKGSPAGSLSSDAAKFVAQQAILGDPNAITSLARSGPARTQVENEIASQLKEMPDGAQFMIMNRLRIVEAKAAATQAGRITMNTALYAKEAEGAAQQVVETSKKFSRTNYPFVNAALAAYETQTGDPNVVEFGTAIFSLLNAYGKMSNPTGTGIHDADKERVTHILDKALSQGQIEAAAFRIVTEGRVVADAATKAQGEVLAHMIPQLPGQQPAPTPTPTPPPAPSSSVPIASPNTSRPPSSQKSFDYDAQGNRIQK